MQKRTKLRNRQLPDYTRGEEIMNMVTHITGGGLSLIGLVFCLIQAAGDPMATVSCSIYGATLLTVYSFSSIYHGLYPSTGKKILQVLDHCAIYFLIAGTYTPILLVGFWKPYPLIALGLLMLEWGLCFLAATLTAIDLKKYNTFSMVCYILMGWAIIFFIPKAKLVLGSGGFGWLLGGGIAYTIGAVLYGIGSRKKWMHSVFHIFVVLGSALQFLSIYLYVL